MKNTKHVTITLKIDTIELLDKYSKKTSVNKSALIDRLINEEITKKTK
jgi:hypothetical protein